MKFGTRAWVVSAFAIMLSATANVQTTCAQIANQSENFSDGNFADDAALFSAGYAFSGGGGLDTNQTTMPMGAGVAIGDPDSLDGVNDGGIFVEGENFGDTVTYQFGGTIENGALYRFGANLFKSSTSFTQADVELLANGTTVVASELGMGNINENDTTGGGAAPATLYYRGTAGTAGQSLSFRVRQVRGSNESMDVGIDNWELHNVDLVSPISSQSDTLATGKVPFGYTWSFNGSGGFTDPSGNDMATPAAGPYPGDAAGDGGIFAGGNNGNPNSFVEHRFDGVLETGKQYDFSAYLYQASTSFSTSAVQLVADPGGPNEAVVASVQQNGINNNQLNLASVSYTADGTTAGQQLAFRISANRNVGGSADTGIDGWSLNAFDPNAPLANQFETFSAGAVPAGYTFFTEGTATAGGHLTTDPLTPAQGSNPGDAAADGALFVNGNEAGDAPNTVTHTFLGKIEDEQSYAFSTFLFQSSTSFAQSTIELIANLGEADESVVASLFQDPVNGNSGNLGAPDFNLAQLAFTGDATLDGQSLSVRISSERGAGVSSDVGIDGWALDLVTGLPGDFNGDLIVDGADFLAWQINPSVGSLTDWRNNYGMSSMPSFASAAGVPEPNSLVILLLGVGITVTRRKRFAV